MTNKGPVNNQEAFNDKDKETVKGDKKYDNDVQNDKKIISNGRGNEPDEGEGDVPTEDKIVRDPKTGEETFIKNNNKEWKLK